MHIECVFIEIYLLKNKYLAEIIAYKKIKAFSPMQKTYNIGSTKFSFPFNIELLFHYVVLKCLLQGSQMQLFLHYLKLFSTGIEFWACHILAFCHITPLKDKCIKP